MTYGTRRKRARRQYTPHPQITDDHPSASQLRGATAVTRREDDVIRVVAYDADWPLGFQTLAARVRSLLGARVARVEHIGSTAVPGLAAKPILDVDVVVRAAADLKPSIRELEKAGYRYEGDLGVAGREALRRPPDSEPHHLYLLVEGSPELQRHLAFRDALRADQGHPMAGLSFPSKIRLIPERVRVTSGRLALTDARASRQARSCR